MTTPVILLNCLANTCAEYLLAPIAFLPGWLSATLVAAVTGVFMLLIFKYTSNQRAVKRVRDDIKANLLALSLYNDSVAVSLRCQRKILAGACRLLLLAIVPVLVMTLPMCLLLAQLAMWYQARPLRVGEEVVVTVRMRDGETEMPEVRLEPTTAAETLIGPVRVPSRRMICWSLRAEEDGYHRLTLDTPGGKIEKEFSVGGGFMRVSLRRPGWSWSETLLHPRETPLPQDSAVEAIEIDYPERDAWTSGSDSWLVYWFVASMVAAFCVRPWLNVNI
jgi:uncharacterized membrane protein (DUF106 family)